MKFVTTIYLVRITLLVNLFAVSNYITSVYDFKQIITIMIKTKVGLKWHYNLLS